MKKRKRKYPYRIDQWEADEALYVWDMLFNKGAEKPYVPSNSFLGRNFYSNQWGQFANATGYRRIQILLSPHVITLLKAYALRYNKKTMWDRLQ